MHLCVCVCVCVCVCTCSVRLVSLAAQKFISDIANDALQHCKMRSTGQSARKATKVGQKLTGTNSQFSFLILELL